MRPCPSRAAQGLAADINRMSIRDEKEDYCMRLACQIQQSDSQGHLCTFMSLRDDRLAWMTYCPTSQWKTRERQSTILTLCPFSIISGKEWLRGVRDLSAPSWITQARLYDGNALQKQCMQLIGSSFRPMKSVISSEEKESIVQYCRDLYNTFSGYFDISKLNLLFYDALKNAYKVECFQSYLPVINSISIWLLLMHSRVPRTVWFISSLHIKKYKWRPGSEATPPQKMYT